ncbi:MAG: CpaF family protein [Actinobacteria bacterium]|nr:CpaF family protein [Actinomycetota bacterium]
MNLADRIAAVQAQQTDQRHSLDTPTHVRMRESVHDALLEGLRGRDVIDPEDFARDVRSALSGALTTDDASLPAAERARLAQGIADDLLGHGPLEPLLRDPTVSEIMVNGAHHVFIERHGVVHPTDVQFTDEAHLRRLIERMVSRVGRRVDESSPMVDARLPDGSRINVILPPLALDGPTLTIRKFASDVLGISDLVGVGTLTTDAAEFLAAAVRGRVNVLVSGATGTGKTTTLNVLSSFIPSTQRIITIEDAAELRLQQQHVVRLESRPPNLEGKGEVSVRDLVRNALRMRPDRIIVGEVRDSAALDMLAAMATGHDGSICTVHASSPREALSRIETMILTGGADLPLTAVREMVVSAIDLIVHQHRAADGRRRITAITEVTGREGEVITLQDVFVIGSDGILHPTGVRPRFLDTFLERGDDLSRVHLIPAEAGRRDAA